MGKLEPPDVLDDVDVEDVAKEVEDDEADEEEVEQTESQDGDRVKDKEVEAKKPLQMIGVQLLKDSDQTTTSSKRQGEDPLEYLWRMMMMRLVS
ncbi:hypothetical protein SLA2020_388470 [Shorea laevis]